MRASNPASHRRRTRPRASIGALPIMPNPAVGVPTAGSASQSPDRWASSPLSSASSRSYQVRCSEEHVVAEVVSLRSRALVSRGASSLLTSIAFPTFPALPAGRWSRVIVSPAEPGETSAVRPHPVRALSAPRRRALAGAAQTCPPKETRMQWQPGAMGRLEPHLAPHRHPPRTSSPTRPVTEIPQVPSRSGAVFAPNDDTLTGGCVRVMPTARRPCGHSTIRD
jgi:hypothetical protein